MRPQLSDALINAHPSLFVRSASDTEAPDRCLIECHDGWHDLLDQLASDVEAWALSSGASVYIWQIKEKFGTLRVHWRPHGADMPEAAATRLRAILQAAEANSATLCERCGNPGVLTVDDGIARTRCGDHRR